ncbi:hypothetical protein CR513_59626, partial [Mucuna pruriens]
MHSIPITYTASYNIVIGHLALNKLRVVVSTLHLCMKYLVGRDVDQKILHRCYEDSLRVGPKPTDGNTTFVNFLDLDQRQQIEDLRSCPVEELKEIHIDPSKLHRTKINMTLDIESKGLLVRFLTKNRDNQAGDLEEKTTWGGEVKGGQGGNQQTINGWLHPRATIPPRGSQMSWPIDHNGNNSGEWFLSVDGASNQKGSGAGIILEGLDGVLIKQSLRFEFKTSNNRAKYKTLLIGMKLAKELKAQILMAKSDFKIVNREYQARDPQLIKYWDRAMKLVTSFKKFTLLHVLWEQSERADLLSKYNWSVIHKISKPTIEEPSVYYSEARQTWMDSLLEYFRKDTIPKDTEAAKRLKWEASKYILIGEYLYRRGFDFPQLKCLDTEEAECVMQEVHEGVCGSHIGGCALASKIARVGYYCPTLKSNCS